MKKSILIIILIIITAAAFLILRFFSGDEDIWLCVNGEWVKHGNPSAAMPITGCGNQKQQAEIIVSSPQPNETIKSPLLIEGKARGSWYFEAVAPVQLIDANNNVLASGQIQAQSDWMTADFVNFKSQLSFTYNATSSGILVFQNDNPSGLPENSKEFRVPVQLVPTNTMTVKVFFNNNNFDPQISCNKVFPVNRIVLKTQATATAALEELLKGPTQNDTNSGYYTNIPAGVKIQKLTIENGAARVDFNETIEKGGGSCHFSALASQIIQTLKQFSTVKSVVISINGRTEDILQP